MPDPTVTLKVGGLALTSFDSITIERNLDSFADSFVLTTKTSPEIRAKIRPKGYEPCEVWMAGQKIITGTIEQPDVSMATLALNIEGRSLAGAMLDGNIKGAVQFGNQTLGAVARTLADPFGVTVSLPQGDSTPLGQQVVAGDGDSPASFLQRLGLDMGWLWRSDASGQLVMHKPPTKGPVVARLVEGQGIFLDCRLGLNGTGLFSEYNVVQQMGGWENIPGQALDASIPSYRMKRRTGSDGNPREVKKAALMDKSLALNSALGIEVDVGDWTTDAGIVWEPGQFVEVTAPSCWLDNPTIFQISGVPFSLTNGGRLATLRLMLPGTYTGEAVLPW